MNRSPDTLLELFEQEKLDPQNFSHRDHVALAWALLRRDPALQAMAAFIEGLLRMTRKIGKPEIYHATITWAFLLLIRERMSRHQPEATWETFAEKNADLFVSKPSVLERYYQPETLSSELARQVFLLPDRLAAPV